MAFCVAEIGNLSQVRSQSEEMVGGPLGKATAASLSTAGDPRGIADRAKD